MSGGMMQVNMGQAAADAAARTGWLIGNSPEMQKLLRILDKVAISSHPVLVLGESGTGKEAVAREIHERGTMGSGPFAVVDCASAAPSMLARDLFGHCPAEGDGAWENDGLLCAAAGGTVFLDEVGALSPELQTMLLRALQAKEVRSFGTAEHRPVTARILAASSRNLQAMVDAGQFRKDLYYRLNVVKLQMPALRERKADLPELLECVLRRMESRYGRRLQLSEEAVETVRAYAWPGNLRELEAAVERACSTTSGPVVHLRDLPSQLQDSREQRAVVEAAPPVEERRTPVLVMERIVPLAELERRMILLTVEQVQGDKMVAAKLLGIGKTTLYRKLKEYGVPEMGQQHGA